MTLRITILMSLAWLLSVNTSAQTRMSIAGTASTMLISPNLFTITKKPIGFGAQLKVEWQNRRSGNSLIELGFESYKFENPIGPTYWSTKSEYIQWSHLSTFYGGRSYLAYDSKGLYFDRALGIFCALPVGVVKSNKLHPGAGAMAGAGYAAERLDFGVQIKLGVTNLGIAFTPLFWLGLRINK